MKTRSHNRHSKMHMLPVGNDPNAVVTPRSKRMSLQARRMPPPDDSPPDYLVQSKRLSVPDAQAIQRHWLAKVSDHVSAPSEYTRMEPGERFPSCSELATLPIEIQLSVRRLAITVLKHRLLPMIAIHQRRKVKAKLLRAALMMPESSVRPSPSFLAFLPIFARWDRLDEVSAALVPRVYTKDETIVHKGELPNSGIHIISFGFAQMYYTESQQAAANQRSARAEAESLPILSSPSIVGDATAISRHPQRENYKAISPECVVWTLPLPDFERLFRFQLHDVQRYHEDAAMLFRLHNMRKVWQVTWKLLQRFPIFSVLPEAIVVEYVPRKLTTKVYRSGSHIYRAGEVATSLFLLVNGTVLLRRGNRRDSLGTRIPDETIVHAPAIIGDLSWIHVTKRRQHAFAQEMCDMYILPRDAVAPMLNYIDTSQLLSLPSQQDNNESSSFRGARPTPGKNSKQEELAALGLDFLKYVRYVRAIPLLMHLLPVDDADDANNALIRDLATAFSPIVFHSKATLASTTQVCDRILFVLGGRAVVQIDKLEALRSTLQRRIQASPTHDSTRNNSFNRGQIAGGVSLLERSRATSLSPMLLRHSTMTMSISLSSPGDALTSPSTMRKAPSSSMLVHGECIGYTLLHPHKWKHRVVAIDTVECVQILFDDYEAILKRHGVHNKVLTLSNALMFPLDAVMKDIAEAQEQICRLRNIQMFPVSSGVDVEPECRYPTKAVLQRLPPIAMQNRLTTCSYSGASMSRITMGPLPPLPIEGIAPMVLGKHNKIYLPFSPNEKLSAPQRHPR